ncbi:MAG: flagellar basal body rod protein FlgB [Burkholderiaceae bacterium]|jgi:flagellar basal-body rod protein FlgB|nr:flagellar basal body rod protein FlgB [Burkholderiaceae bacterium]
MDLLNNALGIHERALHARSQRLELLAQNIANADTPHFKARDIDFKKVMAGQMDQPMQATNSQHFSAGELPSNDGLVYRVPFNTSFDGNTVEMSVEQSNYGKASADYQATLSFLESRVSGIRKALRGE